MWGKTIDHGMVCVRMAIRPAAGDDIAAIQTVAETAWHTDYPDILTRETVERGVTDWYSRDQMLDAIHHARTLLLVAEREDDIMGFAHGMWTDEADGYVLRLYVHPDHRRQNLGRGLLERTCNALLDRGAERINAMVLAENTPGNEFYQRFGFELVDEQETTIGDKPYLEYRYVLDRAAAEFM